LVIWWRNTRVEAWQIPLLSITDFGNRAIVFDYFRAIGAFHKSYEILGFPRGVCPDDQKDLAN
jgi:hypothetical protein